MWQDHLRQGTGVVVTQFGLYYEGAFKDNKMAVSAHQMLIMWGCGSLLVCALRKTIKKWHQSKILLINAFYYSMKCYKFIFLVKILFLRHLYALFFQIKK